jgi:hypothetical protein
VDSGNKALAAEVLFETSPLLGLDISEGKILVTVQDATNETATVTHNELSVPFPSAS